jgi:uncharacterized LabA/DUF88 family protein
MNNFAFIDGMNLHMTYENLTWRLDYRKLRIYLQDRYSVLKAYYFVGNLSINASLYIALEKDGYTIVTKPISHLPGGKIKGNCDAELVLQAMIDKSVYDGAVIITSDGDFACLVTHLLSCNKLFRVIAPCYAGCSHLLKEASGAKIDFLDNAKVKIEYK